MNFKVAVIGGNGFIGKNLSAYLSSKGYNVVIVDHSSPKTPSSPNLQYFSADIHHTRELWEKIADVEYVIWLVHASVPSTEDDSLADDFLLNIAPIVKFLEKAGNSYQLKKFIYLSSGGTVYGDSLERNPFKEEHPQQPISNYGLSKSVAEKYINYLTRGKSFETVILRPSNVYGPFQNLIKPQGIIGFGFKAIKNNLALDLYDGGKVIRDFIYVDDLSDAVEKCLIAPIEAGSSTAYNLGSNEAVSIINILENIQSIAGKKLIINHQSSRNFDCQYSVLDSQKFTEKYNWKKTTDLYYGLRKVWDWIQNEN